MKIAIEPITVKFGDTEQADTAELSIYNDDLESCASFRYEFSNSETKSILGNGTVPMTGTDYSSWRGGSPGAVAFILSKLSLTKKS